jgi:hypothetical protein
VTEEKDPKTASAGGPRTKATKASGSDAPRPVTRTTLSGTGPERSRDPTPKREARKATLPRKKLQSIEEISSSLLLSDDSTSTKLPDIEELSGSLLLEDAPAVQAVPLPKAPSAPAAASPSRPAPAAHRALLGIPKLPPSTPAPNLAHLFAPPAPPRETSETLPARETSGTLPPPNLHSHASTAPPATEAPPPSASAATIVMNLQDVPSTSDVSLPSEPTPDATQPMPPVQGDVEITALPRPPWVAAALAIKREFGNLKSALATGSESQPAAPKWLLPVVAAGGVAVCIGFVALAVSLLRGSPNQSDARADPSSAAGMQDELRRAAATMATPSVAAPSAAAAPIPMPSSSAAPIVAPVVPTPVAAPPAPEPSAEVSSAPCTVAGIPRVVAPSAIVQPGVEVRTLGNDIAIGFAPNEHLATALRLDAASASVSATIDAQSADAIGRVVPIGSAKGALSLAVDADRPSDSVQGRRTIPLDPPMQIGASGGNLVWAHPGGPVAGTLWPIEGDGPVDAARGAAVLADDASTIALAVRHAGAIWIGAATGHDVLSPLGALARLNGSSSTVGSPAVAINDGVVLAAWADRASSSDPWHLQWVRFKAGEAPGDPTTFVPPAGGKGTQAMSPSVTAVPGGRFLLVWTEGTATRHDVRALTLSQDAQPLGKPLVIASKYANAGQGQASLNAARQGLVAFLESTPTGFQVAATPIRCGR